MSREPAPVVAREFAPVVREPDPRIARTRSVVLETALELLKSEGQSAVTPARLCKLTGVSRSTIYRHWPNPARLVDEAVAQGPKEVDIESTGDLRVDLRAFLVQLQTTLNETDIPRVLAAMIDRASLGGDSRAQLDSFVKSRRKRLASHLARATDGDAGAIERAFPVIFGPLFFERLVARRKVSDQLVTDALEAGCRLLGDSGD